MYVSFKTSQYRVITNDRRYRANCVRVCLFLVSYSFDKTYFGESELCKYFMQKNLVIKLYETNRIRFVSKYLDGK